MQKIFLKNLQLSKYLMALGFRSRVLRMGNIMNTWFTPTDQADNLIQPIIKCVKEILS